jgi:hypothetical protein
LNQHVPSLELTRLGRLIQIHDDDVCTGQMEISTAISQSAKSKVQQPGDQQGSTKHHDERKGTAEHAS